MKSTDTLDLSRNLTKKRVPAELQGLEAYRLVIWEIDPDTNGKFVQDIIEATAEMTVYFFNKSRTRWSAEGLQVSLERAQFAP